MKKIFFIAVSIVSFLFAEAQNTNLDYKYAIKAYNLTSYYKNVRSVSSETDSSTTDYTTSDLKILHPTLAFQWQNSDRNFHELELTSFVLGKLSTQTASISSNSYHITAGSNVITTDIALRYEYIINFNKSETRKLVPSIGFGGSPYYKLYKYQPKIASEIPWSQQDIGLSIFVTPRLTYYMSSRIFFDVNIPVCLFDFNYLISHQDNPFLELSERTSSEINIDMFPKVYSGRIGIGLKL
jgi:hypothetical protein